jgi:hypothetical protein
VFLENMKNDKDQMMRSGGLKEGGRKKVDEVDMSDFRIDE